MPGLEQQLTMELCHECDWRIDPQGKTSSPLDHQVTGKTHRRSPELWTLAACQRLKVASTTGGSTCGTI